MFIYWARFGFPIAAVIYCSLLGCDVLKISVYIYIYIYIYIYTFFQNILLLVFLE